MKRKFQLGRNIIIVTKREKGFALLMLLSKLGAAENLLDKFQLSSWKLKII